jgi:dolichyl-diphosphooligosaccharide---protein glycosyltransferase
VQVTTQMGRPAGYDLARNVEVGYKGIGFEHLEEAFTSEHWIVRIYKRHQPANRDGLTFQPIEEGDDKFGRRAAALPGSRVRARKHLPLWPNAAASSTAGAAAATPEPPAVRYMGCYKLEDAFSEDKVYGGSTTGAYLSLARSHAVQQGKRYFAVARLGGDGHSFAFNTLTGAPDGGNSPACSRPCQDEREFACGCADGACGDTPPEAGQDHVRRWAVYEVTDGPAAAGAAGGRKRGGKGK